MAPTVILIRHAQALHNVNKDYELHDPPLSELGYQQCKELQEHLQNHLEIAQEVELIVISPMRRTLQTAQASLGWLLSRGVPVQLRGEWQENSDKPCDTGTPANILSHEFPDFNFDTVFPEYPTKTERWAYSLAAITQRGIDCRRWLKSRPEKVIAVVSHSGFLRVGVSHTGFANADYRVFECVDGNEASLQEWKTTEERGGGMGKSQKGMANAEPSEFPNSPNDDMRSSIKTPEEVVEEVPR